MDYLVGPFADNAFLARALLAGVIVAMLCAIAGTFVVLRGLAFIGDALAHGVLPGVAGALLVGAPGLVGATVGAVVMIGGITLVTNRSRLSTDTAIGLLFVGMLALGVVIVSRSDSFSGDIVGILFGELLGVSSGDLAVELIALIVIAAVVFICYRPFLLLCIDPEQADVAGFRSRRYHALMLAVVAGTVLASFQAVGTLLVFGMLVAPAGAAALMARNVATMILWAAGLGILAVYLGLLFSYHYDLAAGATVVMVSVGQFFAVFVGAQLHVRWSTRRGAVAAS